MRDEEKTVNRTDTLQDLDFGLQEMTAFLCIERPEPSNQ